MLIHQWKLLILLTGDYGALVMAVIQVFLIIIVISIEDPKEIHDMPYIPKRKRPPRNRIVAYSSHLMNMVCICLDACINSGMKRYRKQHLKLKICTNRQKWYNRTRLLKGHCNMHRMLTHFKDNLWKNSFDSDSHPLMFDDGASTCIANDLRDFMRKLTPIRGK